MLVAVMAARIDQGIHLSALVLLNRLDELNAWPVASTPMLLAIASGPCSSMTFAIVNTLEMDWIDTSEVISPLVKIRPSVVTSAMP